MSFTDDYLRLKKKREEEELKNSIPNPEDIAPVKTEKRTWFESGAFDDGYQFGDVTKTILGTNTDFGKNLISGALGIGEAAVDAGAYLVGGAAKLFGADKFADSTKKFIEKDIIDEDKIAAALINRSGLGVANQIVNGEWDKLAKRNSDYSPIGWITAMANGELDELVHRVSDGATFEQNSLTGDKTDSLVQSGGQLAGTMALQSVGVPWFVTSGVTSFGGEAENAFNQGASYGEAGLSAAISAGAEILSEKLFGGSGLGEKGLINLESLTKGISNKLVKALADYGLDVLAEGSEEVVSQIASNLGTALYREENLEDILWSEEALDEYIESFIGGAVMGGVMNAGKVGSSVKDKTDYRTGLTEKEQKVFDKVYNDRLAEAGENGKLSKTEKGKLYDSVMKDLERGYINTDTIEEVLGGETYESYKQKTQQETSMREELEALENTPESQFTVKQRERLNEIREQLKGMDNNALKSQLGSEVEQLVNGSRLGESYAERARRGQAFEADVTKYDKKQQATIQKAIDSGILNNTNRTHEFVDMIAKISADKGVLFDFTNNEKLKQSGFGLDGKAVNGYVTKDGVTLNIESRKALNSVVGHEITHVLEGTELYNSLQSAIVEYAKSKGDYQGRYDALTKLYKDVEGANIDAELTADLVGDYLFTDEDFIRHLSVENRNVFQKIYDEIKYLCKVATAGSKEARELEKVKRAFEKAYKDGGEVSDTKYSVSEVVGDSGKNYGIGVHLDSDLLTGLSDTERKQMVRLRVVEELAGNSFIAYDNGNPVEISIAQKSDKIKNDSGNKKPVLKELYNKYNGNEIKQEAVVLADELIEASKHNRTEASNYSHDWLDNYGKNNWDKRTVYLQDKNKTVWEATLHIANSADGRKILYDIDPIKMTEGAIKSAPSTVTTRIPQNSEKSSATYSISENQNTDNAKESADIRYTMSEDGHPVTEDMGSEVKFSLSNQVEEARELVAVHNITPEKLAKSLEFGGLPMPSIAVLKAQDGHSEFGDISLVFGKDTIDPKAYRTNKVYSGDAWTPTYPNVEYKPSEKVLKAVNKKLAALAPYEVRNGLGDSISLDADNAGNDLNRNGGNMVEAYRNNISMKYAFLKDTESDIELPMKEADLYYYGHISNDAVRYFGGKLVNGLQTVEHYQNMGAREMLKDASLREAVADAMNFDVLRTMEPGSEEYLAYVKDPAFKAEEIGFSDVDKMLSATRKLFTNGVQQTVDRNAAKEAINSRVDQSAYENWLKDLFSGVVEKEGIRNEKDLFTPSGNRRSFEALHYENNLENVIKAMREKGDKGLGGFGGGNIFGAATTEFSSIEEMKQSSNRLQIMPEEKFEEIRQGFSDRFFEIAKSLPNNRESFTATDDAANMLIEAVQKYKTKSGMAKYLRTESQGWATYSDHVVDDRMDLVSDIRNMPTGYFEAKPQRAVGFDEVEAVLVPDNLSEELFSKLSECGFNVVTYEAGNEADRTAKLNELDDLKFSLSQKGEYGKQYGNYNAYGKDIMLNPEDIALGPVAEGEATVAKNAAAAPADGTDYDLAPVAEDSTAVANDTNVAGNGDDIAPVDVAEIAPTTSKAETVEDIAPVAGDTDDIIKTVKERLNAKLANSTAELENIKLLRDWVKAQYAHKIAQLQSQYDSKKNKTTKVAVGLTKRIENLKRVSADLDADLQKRIADIESKVAKTNERIQREPGKKDILEIRYERINQQFEKDKLALAEEFRQRKSDAQMAVQNKNTFISNKALELYNELRNLKKGVKASEDLGYLLDQRKIYDAGFGELKDALLSVKNFPDRVMNEESAMESAVREAIGRSYENNLYAVDGLDAEYNERLAELEAEAEKSRQEARKEVERVRRKDLHAGIVDNIKSDFAAQGYDFDEVLKNARNLSTFSTVDNTPQRVMEKALGYEEGKILADSTVNQVAQNETEGIKWLNSITDRKSGLLKQLSEQYHIKPGSKESAAAQMYAEGFYVNEKNEIIKYGDAELAKDFPDTQTQRNIKGLAADPRIRQFYDDTLDAINQSRTRNAYPEIPKLDNYFLHFRAMDDTFSRLGLPFNPNDIRAKDLPTDLNGVTADLKPGQPFFTSAMHREGKRTSFDLLGGLERYANSAKNQIYHIDDIQTLRALRNYIADTYGQAHGLENLDSLSEEEAQERIKEVYNSHLSTFAKFLNEEANILAGKTALIDRGLEGIIGRRGITFLDTVNRQVGSNMVGYNISSSLTNFLPVAQAFAKTNKADFVKGFAQTVANKVSGGKLDTFAQDSPVMIRRKGADRFYRNLWQKMSDPGYALMGAVDNISTEMIARTKFNELTRKGMDAQQAHIETDKWVSRLMGDRSLGQMPQIYNSKMLGLITKFQLEVRNQLDAQFYDTIQDAKVSNAHIESNLERNAKTAAKVASTFAQLAVVQHLFGKAFESVAGYNPAFDIISVIATAFGWDDDEESEDTFVDNLGQGLLELMEDLPYTGTLTGGRIPISSALPDVEQLLTGENDWGGKESRLETLLAPLPYYLLPGGFGQIKKTMQGLDMFSSEHPIAGSYTDSGNLRFPVADTIGNRVQAGLFGQWANRNAGDYFDNDWAPLNEKQIDEYSEVGMSFKDYHKYRDGLKDLNTMEEKFEYISGLDLTDEQKNILINNIVNREEPVDISDYDQYGSYEEYDFATKNQEKYQFFKNNNISYSDYAASEDSREAYNWAYNNPERYTLSKAVAEDVVTYRKYAGELNGIKADKDESGKTIVGSRREKVIDWLNKQDMDYGAKIILFKSEYPSDDTYNMDIIDYLNSRDDISYQQMETILKELGFTVDSEGNVSWD